METKDYVFENWMKEAYEDTKSSRDKMMILLLREMNGSLARIVELLESQGRVRPS